MEVSGDALQAALARAITDSVTPEMQKEIFAKAMGQFLFNADTRRGEVPPITSAFQDALRLATKELANKIVNEPENQTRISDVIRAAFDETMSDPATVTKLR
ncbi:MAG TPA: hypothetical protein VII30_08270, partial [Gemmatimonadaceae bacterium]